MIDGGRLLVYFTLPRIYNTPDNFSGGKKRVKSFEKSSRFAWLILACFVGGGGERRTLAWLKKFGCARSASLTELSKVRVHRKEENTERTGALSLATFVSHLSLSEALFPKRLSPHFLRTILACLIMFWPPWAKRARRYVEENSSRGERRPYALKCRFAPRVYLDTLRFFVYAYRYNRFPSKLTRGKLPEFNIQHFFQASLAAIVSLEST